MNNIEKGNGFENYVASIYRSLGYRVQVSQDVLAQQVDVLAEKHIGEAGVIKLAIECKFLSKGSVKNQHVHDFLSVVSNMIRSGKITKGVMVTNLHFSDDAKRVAEEDSSIQLLTIEQLENSIFELTSAYLIYKDAYEKRNIFNTYVPLKATEEFSAFNEKKIIENIETYIVEYASKTRNNFLTIFGDYGAGKTTLLERIKYNFVQKFLRGESTIKPITILLKDFQEHQSIDKLLHYSIIKEFNHEIPVSLFKNAVNEGNILLLLDGFDEMIQQVDDRIRKENFHLLCKLLPANAILTCRPSYFGTYAEYNSYLSDIRKLDIIALKKPSIQKTKKVNRTKLVSEQLMDHFLQKRIGYEPVKNIDFVTLRLATFDEPQIDIYLQKFNKSFLAKYGKDWLFIKGILKKTYGIEDLLRRPILLEILVDTVLFENFDITKDLEKTGPAHLYEIYTTYHLSREWDKGKSRQLIRNEDRKIFATAIGVSMFLDNRSSVSYHEIKSIIKEQFSNAEISSDLQDINIEHLAVDIQTCAFLTISLSGDQFSFVHKSYMEFFVSRFIIELILKFRRSKILEYVLTKEIIYFLQSFCLVNEDLKNSVLVWHKRLSHVTSASSNHRRNICCILLSVFKKPRNLSFDDYNISFISLDAISFNNCSFVKTVFSEVTATELVLEQAQNSSISIINSDFKKSSIECQKLNLFLSDSVLADMTFTAANMQLQSLQGGLIKDSVFSFRSANFSGSLRLENCTFDNCLINLSTDGFSESAVNMTGSKFNHCTLSIDFTSSNHNILMNSVFEKCTLAGLIFNENDYTEKKIKECKGFIFVYEFHTKPGNKILNDMLEFQNDYSKYKAAEDELQKKISLNKNSKKDNKPEEHLQFEHYYIVDKKLLVIYEPAWRYFKNELLTYMNQKDGRSEWIADFVKRHKQTV